MPFSVKMRPLRLEDVYVQVGIEQDWVDPRDKYALDDPLEERRIIADINERLDHGDVWAWCVVTVEVQWRHFKASSSGTGANSYRDERDFRQSAEFLAHVADALRLLNESIQADMDQLIKLVEWEDIGDPIVLPDDLTALTDMELEEWTEIIRREAAEVERISIAEERGFWALKRTINKNYGLLLDEGGRRRQIDSENIVRARQQKSEGEGHNDT